MARTPEFSTPLNQFVQSGESIIRRVDNHTKRKGLLGKSHLIIEGKGKAKKIINRFRSSEGQRPKVHEKLQVEEGLEAPITQRIEVNAALLPERTVYLDPELIKEESQFAGLPEKLADSQKLDPTNPDDEQINPDLLAEPVEVWSLEGMQEHISDRVPGENEGMYDYAATKLDITS